MQILTGIPLSSYELEAFATRISNIAFCEEEKILR